MKQTRLMSLLESIGGTAIGFVVAFFANMLVLPWFGLSPSVTENLLLTTVYTAISILRGFGVRRLFEALHIRRPLSPFMQAAIAERFRQVEAEGWSIEHDDAHVQGELALAGGCYAITANQLDGGERFGVDRIWPWSLDWWKPVGFRRDLVKAAALIIAEGEKFDRQRKRKSSPQAEAT